MARQVLENGVILPAEYSDEWYDDMTSNLTKLDDVIGSDSEKLSSSDVGAAALSNDYNDLDNLPTIPTVNDATLTIQKNGVDVQTFTANASSNVTCNITVPSKTSDLTNDSNFVDTSNSAVSSGITSAKVTDYDTHIADSDIHVTTADKNRWNNQTYVFRYSSTVLVASSTNSNALLDNTDNLKAGDKVIDSSGVLFSITAIDTANSTFTVGTALIDLANDSDVVHKSGNETIAGVKTFSDDITLQGTTTPVIKTISNIVQDTSAYNGSVSWVIRDKDNLNNILESSLYKYSAKSIDWQLKLTGIDNGVSNSKGIRFTLDPVNNVANFLPIGNNNTSLGNSSTKWKDVYATNYYYGSNNVEFSTKFVTTDTAQTITGNKTFSSNVNVYNSDSSTDTANIVLKNSKVTRASSVDLDEQQIIFLDKNNKQLGSIKVGNYSGGTTRMMLVASDNDGVSNGIYLRKVSNGTSVLPTISSGVKLGDNSARWYDVFSNRFNGVEPSSLSLPSGDANDVIDISSYLVNLDGTPNTYTAPVNGWIAITMSNSSGIQAFITGFWGHQVVRPSLGGVRFLMPILKDKTANILIFNGSIDNARFIPCQGNV